MNSQVKSGNLKIAVTSREDNPGAQVYEQFGRTYWFMIYSCEKRSWSVLDNIENRTRKSGAGIATTETLLDLGVDAVLTGETGPKVFRLLTEAGVEVVHNINGIVEDALQDWLDGNLRPAKQANDAGSPNCLMNGPLVGRRDGPH